MFTSTGKLRYYKDPLKVIVEVDQGISEFYRSLIPKHIRVVRQMYPAHISVVRKEIPPNMDMWGKYNNKLITFEYEHYIYNNYNYFWLNAYCDELEAIRIELGLTGTSAITRSPDNKHKFHVTIANTKGL